MQLKVELFLAQVQHRNFKRFGIGTLVPDCTIHASSTSEAIYLRLQGVSDGDNYAALELWNSTGTKKWQFAHKSFPGDEGDFGFIIGQVLVG
jgi:hypothetical protein